MPSLITRRGPARRSIGSFLIGTTVLSSTWTGVKVGGLNLCDTVLICALGVILLEAAVGKRRLPISWWMFWPTSTAVFVLAVHEIIIGTPDTNLANFAGTSTGYSALENQGGGIIFVARLALATSAFAIALASEISFGGRKRAVLVAKLWVLGAAASAWIAVLDTTGLTSVQEYTYHFVSPDRAVGLAFHPNSFAQSLALTLPVAAYFATRSERAVERLGWLLCVSVSVVGLVLANSRGGLLVGLVALVCALTATAISSTRGRVIIFVLALPIALASATIVQWLRANTRLGGSAGTAMSDAGRSDYLSSGIAQFLAHPLFGVGVGAGDGVAVPVALAASGGLILLIGYYAFFSGLRPQLARARVDPFIASCSVSVFALLTMGLVNNSVNERFDFIVVIIASVIPSSAIVATEPTQGPAFYPKEPRPLSNAAFEEDTQSGGGS